MVMSVTSSRDRFRDRSKSRSYTPIYKRKNSRSPLSNRKRHIGRRDDPQVCKTLGVFGLSLYTTETEIEAAFSKFDGLASCRVVVDKKTQVSKGFAFVTFESKNTAAEAKHALNNSEIDGRKIRVDFSITRREHTPTPGVYMGRPGTIYQRRDGEYRVRRSPSPFVGPRYTRTPSRSPSYIRRYRRPSRDRRSRSADRRRHHRYRPRSRSRHRSRSMSRPRSRQRSRSDPNRPRSARPRSGHWSAVTYRR